MTALVFGRTSLLASFFEPLDPESQQYSAGESESLDVYAPTLLVADPSSSFEQTLGNVARGKIAAGNLVYVFTKSSPLHYGMKDIQGVRLYLFTSGVSHPSPSERSNELLVPQNDTSVTLDLLDKTVSTARKAPITIIFDSVSDMALLLGTEDTYKFLKQAEQILVPPNLTSIYLVAAGAQDERTLNIVKSLFRLHAVLDQQGISTTKGAEFEGAKGEAQ